VIRHETGHAIDEMLQNSPLTRKRQTNDGGSKAGDFLAAYAEDVARIKRPIKKKRGESETDFTARQLARTTMLSNLDYLLQTSPAGESEAFAELAAIALGGGSAGKDQLASSAFRKSLRIVKQKLKNVR
jgi:hypothetical protein